MFSSLMAGRPSWMTTVLQPFLRCPGSVQRTETRTCTGKAHQSHPPTCRYQPHFHNTARDGVCVCVACVGSVAPLAPSPKPVQFSLDLLVPSLLPRWFRRTLLAPYPLPARCLFPPCRRALAFCSPLRLWRLVMVLHPLWSSAAPAVSSAPYIKDS